MFPQLHPTSITEIIFFFLLWASGMSLVLTLRCFWKTHPRFDKWPYDCSTFALFLFLAICCSSFLSEWYFPTFHIASFKPKFKPLPASVSSSHVTCRAAKPTFQVHEMFYSFSFPPPCCLFLTCAMMQDTSVCILYQIPVAGCKSLQKFEF